ncbi:MAG TPA: N-formylglutamate amidohydrolase, partial [Caulobacteraceae bacterium]|nr:N-formylglutamate amidohydrolase [Caulobacteraceae bacterium]
MDDATPSAPVFDVAPFRLAWPGDDVPATPIICASPHSGRIYPTAMMAASQLDRRAIRRSEDALVDELIASAP